MSLLFHPEQRTHELSYLTLYLHPTHHNTYFPIVLLQAHAFLGLVQLYSSLNPYRHECTLLLRTSGMMLTLSPAFLVLAVL